MDLWIQIFFSIECFLKQDCILLSISINDMRIYISDHTYLRMARVTLYCFYITAIQLQLIGNRCMAEAVKNNRWQIMFLDQFLQCSTDQGILSCVQLPLLLSSFILCACDMDSDDCVASIAFNSSFCSSSLKKERSTAVFSEHHISFCRQMLSHWD